MRTSVAVLMLLFASLLLIAGCSGEESKATDENAPAAEPAQTPTVEIINSFGERVEVEVEIADDDAERQRGLMERTALAENAGMLFVYDREEQRSFTMRNTLIPLSIAFFDAAGRIVDIQDMQPLDDVPPPYISAAPAQYALEVNQGFFEARGIGVGDEAELPDLPDTSG